MQLIANLYLVRHAQTAWNVEGRIQGATDLSLTSEGVFQAELLADKFSSIPIEAIYTSPLKRAHETAAVIALRHKCKLFIDENLREGYFGSLEGLTREEFFQRFQQDMEEYIYRAPLREFTFKWVSNAESCQEIADRILPTLKKICSLHLGHNVIVVTHGFVIRTLLATLGCVDEKKLLVPNGEIIEIQGDGNFLERVS